MKKQKTGKRAPARTPVPRSSLSTKYVTAPSAVGSVAKPFIKFSGSAHGGMRCQTLTALASVDAATGFNGQLPGFKGTVYTGSSPVAGTSFCTIALNPWFPVAMVSTSSTTWFSGRLVPDGLSVAILAGAFSRYRVIRARLIYSPAAGTNNDRSYSLGFSSDVYNPVVGSSAYYTGGGNVMPSYATCKQVMASKVFPKWLPWTMDLPCDSKAELYVRSTVVPGAGNPGTSLPLPDESRLAYWGSLSLNASDGGATPVGELYLEAEYEFWDFSPQGGVSGGAGPTLVVQKLVEEKDAAVKEMDTSEDIEVIPPPTFRPAPSTVPGSSAYRPAAPYVVPPPSPAPPPSARRS